jgi:hypothetical protein
MAFLITATDITELRRIIGEMQACYCGRMLIGINSLGRTNDDSCKNIYLRAH